MKIYGMKYNLAKKSLITKPNLESKPCNTLR
jgi:hypothetical protein